MPSSTALVPLERYGVLSRKLKPEPDDCGGCVSTFAANCMEQHSAFSKNLKKNATHPAVSVRTLKKPRKTQDPSFPERFGLWGASRRFFVCVWNCARDRLKTVNFHQKRPMGAALKCDATRFEWPRVLGGPRTTTAATLEPLLASGLHCKHLP